MNLPPGYVWTEEDSKRLAESDPKFQGDDVAPDQRFQIWVDSVRNVRVAYELLSYGLA